MRARGVLAGEKTGAFQNHIDTQITPGQFGRIALCKYTNAIAINDDIITVNLHFTGEAAMCSIVLRQMRIGCRITQIINCNHIKLFLPTTFEQGPEYVSPDTAVPVYRQFYRHRLLSKYMGN